MKGEHGIHSLRPDLAVGPRGPEIVTELDQSFLQALRVTQVQILRHVLRRVGQQVLSEVRQVNAEAPLEHRSDLAVAVGVDGDLGPVGQLLQEVQAPKGRPLRVSAVAPVIVDEVLVGHVRKVRSEGEEGGTSSPDPVVFLAHLLRGFIALLPAPQVLGRVCEGVRLHVRSPIGPLDGACVLVPPNVGEGYRPDVGEVLRDGIPGAVVEPRGHAEEESALLLGRRDPGAVGEPEPPRLLRHAVKGGVT